MSALFVKELLFPQTAPTDDAFFNQNWAGAGWNRWVGPLALDVGLLFKNKKQRGSAGARPLPLRCLSQFFPDEEKINCLKSEFFVRTFHRWGGLVFIVDVFLNWMVIRILSYWMGDPLSLSLSD